MQQFMPITSERRAFTLTEMLIAVAILGVVILATSTIFGTAQRVSSCVAGHLALPDLAHLRVRERPLRRNHALPLLGVLVKEARVDLGAHVLEVVVDGEDAHLRAAHWT